MSESSRRRAPACQAYCCRVVPPNDEMVCEVGAPHTHMIACVAVDVTVLQVMPRHPLRRGRPDPAADTAVQSAHSPRQREGCVPIIAFRRPPQSHVTSLPDFHREPERRRPRSTEAGTRPSGGHSPRQQGRGTRREPHGLRRGRTGAQNAQTGATPGPRKRQRARAQRDGQIACRHATHPAAALQVAVLEAGGEGRAWQLAPALSTYLRPCSDPE